MPIWIKSVDKMPPENETLYFRRIGFKGGFRGEFKIGAWMAIADQNDEGYNIEDTEWLDEYEPSFDVHQIRDAYEIGFLHGTKDAGSFNKFMKEQYNIDL